MRSTAVWRLVALAPIALVGCSSLLDYDEITFGWSVAAGETYLVALEGVGSGTITYELKPINCP